jgi:hypothetical protein
LRDCLPSVNTGSQPTIWRWRRRWCEIEILDNEKEHENNNFLLRNLDGLLV